MTDALYLVLNEPFPSKPQSRETICLVAPISAAKTPQLVVAAAISPPPRQGQVLNLSFKDARNSEVDWHVVDVDPTHCSKVQEFYQRQHGTLVTKSDWSEPGLQRFYSLDLLVSLTGQDQRMLLELLEKQPHVLLFQEFKELPCLSYEQYSEACRLFGTEAAPSELVQEAQYYMRSLEHYYFHNIRLTHDTFTGACSDAALELLESVGVSIDEYGEYSWALSQSYERELSTQLHRFTTGTSRVNTYIFRRASESYWGTERDVADCFCQRMVVLGTGAAPSYRVDLEIEQIIEWAQQRGTYIDLSAGHLMHRVQELCLSASYLFLHNAHLISVPALVGLLKLLPDSLDGLVLYYDCGYSNPTVRYLDSFADANMVVAEWRSDDPDNTAYRLMTPAYWLGRLNARTLVNGYSFASPVSWMSPDHLATFLQFYWRVRSEAVILTSHARDEQQLESLIANERAAGRLTGAESELEPGELLTLGEDLFGGVLQYSFTTYDGQAIAATQLTDSSELQLPQYYASSEAMRLRVLSLGQCKFRPKYVFFYTTQALDQTTLYKVAWHAREAVFLNCGVELLSVT